MNRESSDLPLAPVIAGAAAIQQRRDDPVDALDALHLMRNALEAAADDAGAGDLLAAADVVMMPQGMWATDNPAQVVAPWNPGIRSVVADIGVLQQTLLSRACALIAAGDAEIVLVCGAEAKYRALRSQILGVAVDDPPTTGSPDERMVPAHEILTREEIDRGLPVPARQYAMIDTALRDHDGLSPSQHIEQLAALWSRFSSVAVDNPDAWNRSFADPAAISSAPMLAWPYTKLHCSQWNVDQAAGIIICSAAAAARHGVAAERRVFAHLGVESNLMVPMTLRAEIHRSPAVAAVRGAVREHLDRDTPDIEHVDLYSCFPAAVRVQASELGIDPASPLTITGGMTFGGGPLNNYTLQSLVAMVRVLRDDPDSDGLVTNVSGMLTKFGASVWSCRPPAAAYRSVD
ncbi:MAG: Acetyl-CoA acetyltransferase, partial [Ilumatobacteraceae bacterium]|nr:Acetyl-CoA acetyltransferase [Ilumatobacteraceae bacterium]